MDNYIVAEKIGGDGHFAIKVNDIKHIDFHLNGTAKVRTEATTFNIRLSARDFADPKHIIGIKDCTLEQPAK